MLLGSIKKVSSATALYVSLHSEKVLSNRPGKLCYTAKQDARH